MKMDWAKTMSLIRNNPYAKRTHNVTRQAEADELGGAVLVEILRALAFTAENPFTEAYKDEEKQKLLLESQHEFALSLKKGALAQKVHAAGVHNPWIPGDHFSLTKQIEIEERSAELADAMKTQARLMGFSVSGTNNKSSDDLLEELFSKKMA